MTIVNVIIFIGVAFVYKIITYIIKRKYNRKILKGGFQYITKFKHAVNYIVHTRIIMCKTEREDKVQYNITKSRKIQKKISPLLRFFIYNKNEVRLL